MRVLGLDPGSRRTGYGVVERQGNRYAVIACGQVVPPPRVELPQRLHTIASRVDALIAEHGPDCVAVEEAFYHESVRSTLVLGHVRGALLVTAAARQIVVAEYTPRSIKLAVTGSGSATKEQVAFMVRRLLGIHGPLPLDASDALAVALCHVQRAGRLTHARAISDATRRLEALLARKRAP